MSLQFGQLCLQLPSSTSNPLLVIPKKVPRCRKVRGLAQLIKYACDFNHSLSEILTWYFQLDVYYLHGTCLYTSTFNEKLVKLWMRDVTLVVWSQRAKYWVAIHTCNTNKDVQILFHITVMVCCLKAPNHRHSVFYGCSSLIQKVDTLLIRDHAIFWTVHVYIPKLTFSSMV